MSRPAVVAVVGSVNMDLSVTCPRLPTPGETVLADTLTRSPGGKGGNQAVAAARAGGATTLMVGAVGDDDTGADLRDALSADGVDTQYLAGLAGVPTGVALITVDERGENTIVVAVGANHRVELDHPARAALARADVVLAQLEVPQETVAAAAACRRAGALFVLNAAPAAPIIDSLADEVDLLVVNEGEAIQLAGVTTIDDALGVLLARMPAVLVTLGADGCRLRRRDGYDLAVPARRVTAVDTVAAGDTFCGVLAARLAAGADDETAVRAATAAASLTVQRRGAQQSIPTAAEVEELEATARG